MLMGAVALAAWPARAAEPDVHLTGPLTQGGLIIGKAPPGTSIVFEGRALMVSPEGAFAFGFGRDAPAEAKVMITDTDGRAETRMLAVTPRTYDIQRIDGLPDAMVTPAEETLERIKREAALVAAARDRATPILGFTETLRWPLPGIISGVYGSQRVLNGEPRRPHFGVDIAAPEGTPIKAPMSGVVSLAEKDLYYTGGTIILDHGHGVSTTYLHMSRLDVALGRSVAAGDLIGAVGKTGRATGPHLCWRLNWFQERLDPQLVAPAGGPA
ncbi:MAG: peptidoglycan DD-metalloendopeptidase family protein [Alphaproteobacteria bacterium]|nr:peptidoglycan DD-metalloendopeptidase family protein [Alphaproteobacteria bacterium]